MSTIGNTTPVTFIDFGKEIDAKVDTGATSSSLHAENIKVVDRGNDKQVVQFLCPPLSDNLCYLPVIGNQEIRSASGTQIRPVVKLEVVVNGKDLGECEFNLADRGNMEAAVLLGQNVLQAGDFTIEVNKDVEQADDPNNRTNESEDVTSSGVTEEDLLKFLDGVPEDAFVTLTKGEQTITLTYDNLRSIIQSQRDVESKNDKNEKPDTDN